MKNFNIPIARTSLNNFEIESVLEPLKSGWLVQGPKVKEFESLWSEFVVSEESIAVTSCTTALELSLISLGLSPGDEVIVPAFTWISTASVVEHLGGKVIFADIELDTFNIDYRKIEDLITPKTKFIIPVHLFGLPANMDKIMQISRKFNLIVVEDGACGFGAKYKGKHVGNFGDTGCFSFHPRKSITTGEGGMITTKNKNLADKLRILRSHGAALNDLQRHTCNEPFLLPDHAFAGYNFRMTDLQASLGCAQMVRANQIVNERKKIAKYFNDAFQDLNWLKTPYEDKDSEHGFQSYPCLFEPNNVREIIDSKKYHYLEKIRNKRNKWMNYLYSKGIATRPSTHAVHMLSYFKNKYSISPEQFPNAQAANECSISLPLFHGMKEEEINYLIEVVKESEN